MSDVFGFRDAVDEALRRARPSRNRKDLASNLNVSQSELSKRLNAYHHTGKDGKERTWSLTPLEVFQIVEALVHWKGITSLASAQNLFVLMDYPLQEIDWRADPWSKLRADPFHSKGSSSSSQSNEAPSQRDGQARQQERTLYFQHVIEINEWLMLPGERDVPLERIYVSLRADEMSVKERMAEHALYLQEVVALSQEARVRLPDPYIEFAALRKVIARYPKMFMLDARNWPRLFGKREQQILTLADVVKRHQQVVILGDPGSGKTTLLRWLVLQFARALSRNDTQVRVPADLIQPGAKPGKETKVLDLGLVKLPVFVSIAQYARVRKPKEQPDRGVTLYEYLRSGRFLDPLRLPPGLSQEAAGTLVGEAVRHGQALVILDGLDEVSNLTWRRKIMEAVRRFLQEWCLLEPAREERFTGSEQGLPSECSGNQVVITSRPVGYQFDPLVDLPHYTVEDMDERAITAFCHAWMQHVALPLASAEEASQWANQLHDAIFKEVHPGVRLMAGNPLLLTIMVQLAWKMRAPDGVRALPVRRVTLFEEAARTFYDQREVLWEQAGIKPEQITRAFGAVAYGLHASETAGFATEEEVRQHLRSVLTKKEHVEAVLIAAREVSGFLIARGEGVYGFLHRAVQEYFAAQHLVDQSEQVTSTILAHALNPLWREPVVLAFGLMSRPRYSEEVLPILFTALLDLSDPAGEVLPRRELLAVTACAECEHVPDGVGRRLAQGLLSVYASRSGSSEPSVLQQRIRQTFVLCQRFPANARMEVEDVLCAAVQAEAFSHRFAAVDLIIEIEWDAPAIAEALIIAWRTYADPAGSLLVALRQVQQRQPRWFHQWLLPFKRQIAAKPHLWEYASKRPEWRHMLQVLYLSWGAPFVPEQVNRDSPLTDEILSVLERAAFDPEALLQFRQRLYVLAGQPGTALSRDAALALSSAGESGWIKVWRKQVKNQERLARPALAALAFFFASSRARDLSFARDLARDLVHNRDLNHSLDRVRSLTFALDRDCALARDLDRDRNRAISRARALDRDPARALDPAHELVLDRDRALARLDGIEQSVQDIKQHWLNHADLVQKLDAALTTVELLKQDTHRFLPIGMVWAVLVDIYQAVRKDDESQSELAELAALRITPKMFLMLVQDLVSSDDEQRLFARDVFATPQMASTLGKVSIEFVAQQNLAFSGSGNKVDERQARTQLMWVLQKIIHNRPVWIRTWITKASLTQEETPAAQILEHIHKATPEAFEVLVQMQPTTATHIRKRLLEAFKWLVCGGEVPKEYLLSFAEHLLGWLDQETDDTMRRSMIEVLGAWQEEEAAHSIGMSLLKQLETVPHRQDESILALALAHLARRRPALYEPLHTMLLQRTRTCAAALVCLWTTMTEEPSSTDALLSLAQKELSDPASCFDALFEAGVDEDEWDEMYHGRLVSAAHHLLERIPHTLALEVLRSLLERLHQALEAQDWPARRITLAIVAACAETMPTTLRQAGEGKLESLLVRGTVDADSFTSRRFALTALSYLRTVTAAIVPALLAGCQDTEEVQQDAINAAGRFQRIEDGLLDDLLPALTGESVSTAYAVVHLLGALGTSAAGTSAGLPERIITALVDALKDPRSKRTVTIAGEDKGTLEDVLYDVLLRVAGWIG